MSNRRPELYLYCTCGTEAHFTFFFGTTPAQIQRIASRYLDAGHRGEGHAVCDKRTAQKRRERDDWKRGIVRFR